MINQVQASRAIQLIDPQFQNSATKEQAFQTFKSMINYSQNNSVVNQPQMQNPYMMQMPNGYNPMIGQYYGQSQFGNGNYMGHYPQSQNQAHYQGHYQGHFNQGNYNQWQYGNFQNYPK